MSQFKVGDRVMFIHDNKWVAPSWQGVMGIIKGRLTPSSGRSVAYSVALTTKPKNTSDYAVGDIVTANVFQLEYVVQPVTEDELAEVYKSLGVNDVHVAEGPPGG